MPGRIAMISEHASPLAAMGGVDAGGQNIYVANTARELAAQGYEVDIFTRRDDDALPPVVSWQPGVRIVHIDAGPARFIRKEDLLTWMGVFADRVLDIATQAQLRGSGYALTHAHFFMSGLVARRLKDELSIPYVVTFHALGRVRLLHHGADDFPSDRAMLEQMVMDEADAIIAECPQDALDLCTHYACEPRSITIIPCGFDPAEFATLDRGEARERLKLPPDRPVILQLGRMVPRKGVDNVIRALRPLRHEHGVEPMLLVVGGNADTPDPVATPEIGRLMKIAADERVDDCVRFVGRRPRSAIRDYYYASDVFVTTPWYEPFGITPVEAMACGIPVIGARVGGIQYSVEDGRTGFLVDPKDPAGLAHRLAQLFSDPAIPRLFGRRARRRAYQLFTWRRVAHQLDALYAHVAGVRRSASSTMPFAFTRQAG
jgi:D-inositol-3-phosphate glycosyltransferase